MPNIRRTYVYVIAAASLAFLIYGLLGAGSALLEMVQGGIWGQLGYRQAIAGNGAAIIVALPLWVLHWSWAQRLAANDSAERSSGIRRLYIYAVLAALISVIGNSTFGFLDTVLTRIYSGSGVDTGGKIIQSLFELVIVGAFWAYTFKVASADRAAVGETGATATLRRWYAYGAQFVALLATLFGARTLLENVFQALFMRGVVFRPEESISQAVAVTVTGLSIWLFHRSWVERGNIADDDRQSTLRAVYTFGIIAISSLATLFSAGETLYWCLARLVGVTNPSAMAASASSALAGPIATVIIFGSGWAYFRHDLQRDESRLTAARRDEVEWLYRYLVALMALGTFVFGAELLLWNLFDEINAGNLIAPPTYFRDHISLGVTMLAVGLPIWLLFWRPRPESKERLSLSRRLYLFAALLASMLTGLVAAVWLVTLLLNVVLAGGSLLPIDIGHALSLVLMAALVALYHGKTFRRDMAFRSAISLVEPPASPKQVPDTMPIRIVVEITEASEGEVRDALLALPSGAKYTLRSA
jgi:Domain of unknown function (DUF5671)